ncbi:hypothetical protein Hdeb2414_s0012g00395151 [Helianthus debilis subsp. tardiflorus]
MRLTAAAALGEGHFPTTDSSAPLGFSIFRDGGAALVGVTTVAVMSPTDLTIEDDG